MSELQDAITRSRKLYVKSKGFQGAYVAGARAALAGKGDESCPYKREATWARAWAKAWRRGFHSVG